MTMTPVMKNVAAKCNKILKPLGFEKNGQHWNRRRGVYIDVVSLQKSQYGNTYVIHVAVHVEHADQFLWPREISDRFLKAWECLVSEYVDVPEIKFQRWWKLEVAEEVEESLWALERLGVPFMEGLHDYGLLADHLLRRLARRGNSDFSWPESFYIAVLKGLQGDINGALAYFERFENEFTPNELVYPRVQDLLGKLRDAKRKGHFLILPV